MAARRLANERRDERLRGLGHVIEHKFPLAIARAGEA
jgi:hypothetical protein